MQLNIGAVRLIEGDNVFLVGRFTTSEPSFVLLREQTTGRETKRNLRKVEPMDVVDELGGDEVFACLNVPDWGTAWVRRSDVREVISMPSTHLRLGLADVGTVILFEHDPNPVGGQLELNKGFAVFGMSPEQVTQFLGR